MSAVPSPDDGQGIKIGRYLLHRQIARGGMATIHIARLMGDEGFSRIVAAKRLLPEFAEDSDFATMFLDEARVASKVHHRNVVPVLDVVATGDEIILVQEYVHGVPLHKLLAMARQYKSMVPVNVAVAIVSQVAAGLEAAHETTDEMGMPLNIVHRDVSPQNIMIAVDGTARLLDFGVAKATMAAHVTRENAFKGKIAYSSPEQLRGAATRKSDIYSLGVVLWELLAGQRMFGNAAAEIELVTKIVSGQLPGLLEAVAVDRPLMPTSRWAQLEAVEPVLRHAITADQAQRLASAADFETMLTAAIPPASASEVAAWLKATGKDLLDKNDKLLASEESSWRRHGPPVARMVRSQSEARRTALAGVDAAVAATAIAPAPPTDNPPWYRRSALVIALAAGLTVALAFVLVLSLRGSKSTATTAPLPAAAAIAPAEPQRPPPPTVIIEAPAPSPGQPVPTATEPGTVRVTVPAEPAHEQPAPHVVQPTRVVEPAEPPRRAPAEPVRRSSPPPARVTRQPPTHTAATPAATTKVAPTVESPVAAPPEPAKPDCNPPYYFDGSKKVFKPNCV
jgi:serine/threonine-protein kinase